MGKLLISGSGVGGGRRRRGGVGAVRGAGRAPQPPGARPVGANANLPRPVFENGGLGQSHLFENAVGFMVGTLFGPRGF